MAFAGDLTVTVIQVRSAAKCSSPLARFKELTATFVAQTPADGFCFLILSWSNEVDSTVLESTDETCRDVDMSKHSIAVCVASKDREQAAAEVLLEEERPRLGWTTSALPVEPDSQAGE
jgi:hypothetical protein